MIHNSRFIIQGKVLRGDGYGKKLGFPTANLDRRSHARRKLKIKLGVWAGWAVIGKGLRIKDKRYKAGIVIGPMDKTGLPKLEAHLIGFKGNLYGKYLNMYLNTYLRPFQRFRNREMLKRQIQKDLKIIQQILT